jgi:D-alanyl-D-alanine carboxypeptidase
MHALLFAALLNTAAVDRAVRLVMRTQHVAGLSIGIARGGRKLFERGYGKSDLGHDTPARAGTVYRIGSLTKPFTAYAVAQLSAERKVLLRDPVETHVPIPWRGVTIEDLIRQRSGIPSYSNDYALDPRDTYPPQALVQSVSGRPLLFEPGTQFEYSNTNYVLLGEIIERVSGMPYSQYLQTAVLTPLGLKHTRYGDQPGEARGYARNTLHMPVAPSSLSYAYAAAGMTSNVPDLLRWLALAREPYYGYRVGDIGGRAIQFATGNVPGYSALEMLVPDTRDYIVILTNADMLDLLPLAQDVLAALGEPMR